MSAVRAVRAARWSRVSSARQAGSDREGLPYQHDLQTAALTALGATDTGIEWQVAKSGRIVHQTPEFADMLEQAGRTFDILLIPYVSRLGRNAEEGLRAARLVTEAGASVYFCEERLNSADEESWEGVAREIVEAEAYRRRLSRTMRRTYASRVVRRGLPAGPPPYGFVPGWTHDPDAAAKVRAVFTDYATDTVSMPQLATKHGLAVEHVKVILRNPAYMGIAQHNGALHPGSMEPIVTPELWHAVEAIRTRRRFAPGGSRSQAPNLIDKRMGCACGRHIALDGRSGRGYRRVRHALPLCEQWGSTERKRLPLVEEPIRAAFQQMHPSDDYLDSLFRQPAPPVSTPARHDTTSARRALADKYARGRLTIDQFTTAIADLDEMDAHPLPPAPARTTNPNDLRAYLHAIAQAALPALGDENLAHWSRKLFRRFEYRSADEIAWEPTDEAREHFIPQIMPSEVRVGMVGGEGLEPPTSSV